MDETDLFFNLRLGEIVLHTHHVPLDNRLSFTYPDARDVNLACSRSCSRWSIGRAASGRRCC
jgi:hypothetical protein